MGEDSAQNGSQHVVEKFAAEIGVAFETARSYRQVADAWPKGERQPDIPFTVHRMLMYEPDRFDLIRSRADWTYAEAKAVVRARQRKNPG
jgi:hypothetical protein